MSEQAGMTAALCCGQMVTAMIKALLLPQTAMDTHTHCIFHHYLYPAQQDVCVFLVLLL